MKDSCRVHRETMSAHLDGAATAAETAAMETHLETCAECRTALEELRWTTGQLRKLEPVEPPPWMAARIMARVRSASAPAPSPWRRFFFPILASPQFRVASLVLVGAAGYYLVTRSPGMLRDEVATRRAAEVAEAPAPPAASQPAAAPAPAPAQAPEKGPSPEGKDSFAAPPPPAQPAPKRAKGSAPPPAERRADPERTRPGAAQDALPPRRAEEAPAAFAPAPVAKAVSEKPAAVPEPAVAGMEGGATGALSASRAAGPAPAPRPAAQSAPSAAGATAFRDTEKKERAAQAKTAPLAVTVEPFDPAAFLPFLQRELARLGAEIVPPPADPAARALTARLDSRRLPELLDRLSRAGAIRERPEAGAALPPVITVTIRW